MTSFHALYTQHHIINATTLLIQKIYISFFCSFILCFLIHCSAIPITLANNDDFVNENEIKEHINDIIQKNIDSSEKQKIIEKLKLALNSISEIRRSKIKIQEYQNIIDNFSSIIHQLYYTKDKNNTYHLRNHYEKNDYNTISSSELRKHQIEIQKQLASLDQELQHAQNIAQSINNSLFLLPQEHTTTKKELNQIYRKISSIHTKKQISSLEKSMIIALQTEKEAKQLKIAELELAQLSANNRQEISRLHIELLKNKYDQLNKKSNAICIQLNNLQEQETTQTIENIETLSNTAKGNIIFPNNIEQQIHINRNLSQSLKKQIQNINLVTLQQRKIASYILQTRQTLSKLLEQAQWINKSHILGETLRTQISKLPKLNNYKTQQLDITMSKLRDKRLQYEEQINNLPDLSSHNNKEYKILTNNQKNILNIQINIQRKLLNSLLTNYDIQILELTKLKIAYEQLKDLMNDINKATHRYLFWIPDTQAITLSYLHKIYQDLYLILDTNILYELKLPIKIIFLKNTKISILLFIFFLFICCTYTTYHRYYYFFLEKSKNQLTKNYQKYFSLSLKNIFWSSIIALPFPILWLIIGHILSQTWEYPIFHIIGKGIIYSAPILWLLITIPYFSSKNGLFILYFKLENKKIKYIMHHHNLSIIVIIFTLITLITFNDYNNKELYSTLGRLCFVILCFCLTYKTYTFKQANFPLYLDKHKSPNNTINYSLWNFMTIFPIVNAGIAYYGYLSLAQRLLMNVETSLIICFISSIVYYTIQCWIITQKYRMLYKYKKNDNTISSITYLNTHKKFLFPIFQHTYDTIINTYITNNTNKKNITPPNIIFEIINNQLLKFVKFIIIFITLIMIFWIWSEFHFIFEFLENITLWDTTSNIQGKNNIQPITLKILLTTILIFFITVKLTKNITPILEITILQYLNLTPGTNYAIITLTKYSIIILGITTGLTYIGCEWSKLQWLIAAIGVGLGFGLQEIFANFISGLIVLFERPIRIGDTITICSLTGKITQINTRATTIKDRDHKEIIIPNKEFITKKFINWSLSDTITRVVLKVPAPTEANITTIIKILLRAAKSCPLVLKIPKPEVYLIDIQHGIPLFEIRMHAAKMSHRMPLRHQVHILIIKFYKKNGIQLPLPYIHTYL